jgi:hypothetical protein
VLAGTATTAAWRTTLRRTCPGDAPITRNSAMS